MIYGYDVAGHRISLTYPDNKSVSYDYDQLGRLDTVTNWDSQVTGYGYDLAGRVLTTTLSNGVTSIFGYNLVGWLTSTITLQSPGRSLPSVTSMMRPGIAFRPWKSSHWQPKRQPQLPQLHPHQSIHPRLPISRNRTPIAFVDGFESGDLSQWSANSTGDGNLSVSSTAALSGTYGMQAVIDDNYSLYVQDDTPDGEIYYRASFEFDPNNISMSNGNEHEILVVYSETSEAILNIHLRYSGGYRIGISFIDNQGNTTSSGWYTINDSIPTAADCHILP